MNLASIEALFLFEEMTSDFQDITVQGQLTYRENRRNTPTFAFHLPDGGSKANYKSGQDVAFRVDTAREATLSVPAQQYRE